MSFISAFTISGPNISRDIFNGNGTDELIITLKQTFNILDQTNINFVSIVKTIEGAKISFNINAILQDTENNNPNSIYELFTQSVETDVLITNYFLSNLQNSSMYIC
jgi:hypothetical protein